MKKYVICVSIKHLNGYAPTRKKSYKKTFYNAKEPFYEVQIIIKTIYTPNTDSKSMRQNSYRIEGKKYTIQQE